MRNVNKIIMTLAVIMLAASCKSNKEITNVFPSNVDFEIQCLGKSEDNRQRMRVWCRGNDKDAAVEHAKREALREVIFFGVREGGDCQMVPLITEVNAREVYDEYFTKFFSKKGDYKKYAKVDGSSKPKLLAKSEGLESYSVVVLVDIPALRKKLIEDDVLKNKGGK